MTRTYSAKETLQILQVILCDFGEFFTTREVGRAAAQSIALHAEAPVSFLLDFQGVRAVGPSALDEILTVVEAHLRRHRDDNVTALAANLDDANREILELVLERGEWPGIAHRVGKAVELLGGRAQLMETLKAAQALGPFTAPQLADHLSLKLPNTNQRLKLLLQTGAVGRVQDENAEHGTRFEYFPLDIGAVEHAEKQYLYQDGISFEFRDDLSADVTKGARAARNASGNGNGKRRR